MLWLSVVVEEKKVEIFIFIFHLETLNFCFPTNYKVFYNFFFFNPVIWFAFWPIFLFKKKLFNYVNTTKNMKEFCYILKDFFSKCNKMVESKKKVYLFLFKSIEKMKQKRNLFRIILLIINHFFCFVSGLFDDRWQF